MMITSKSYMICTVGILFIFFIQTGDTDGTSEETNNEVMTDKPNEVITDKTNQVTTVEANQSLRNLQNNSETRSNKTKKNIRSKDYRDQDILAIPPERPYTPVNPNLIRTFYPVRIIVGESPCIYEKYTYFFDEAAFRNMNAFELLINSTITINENDYYFYDAEDLCISIDDELNVDVWQFDCHPAGYCECGLYFGYVDIDIPPRSEDSQIHYSQIYGLDRKLVVENGECKSGLKGHCSLLDSFVPVKNPLQCSSAYNCVSDNSYIPTLKNRVTNQTYGVCLPRSDGDLQGQEDDSDDTLLNRTSTNKSKIFWHYLNILTLLYLSL